MPPSGTDTNKLALRRALEAYARGEVEPIKALASDHIVWTTNAMPGHYRFGGKHSGRAGMTESLAIIAAEYAITRYVVREMVAEGDVIWTTVDFGATYRKSGAKVDVILVSRWQFAEGKIVAFTEFFDSAGTLSQLGRLPKSFVTTG